MTVALLAISDGRDEAHEAAWASLADNLPACDHIIEVDDRGHTLGFGGAIQNGWERILDTDADWVVHVELDFTFNGRVPLQRIIGVLERHPELAQIVLKRQPCNAEEEAAGGIIEQHPDDFTQHRDGPDAWTSHRRFFSTNVCVYPSRLCRLGWPQVPHSEGIFTHRLLKDPLLRFAFWGSKFAPPTIHHIGVRAGVGY